MNRVAHNIGRVLVGVVLITVAAVLGLEGFRSLKQSAIDAEWDPHAETRVTDFGTTSTLTITPVVNWSAVSDAYQTEAGVSYLVETDSHRLLFDLGFNQRQADVAPLEHNLAQLNVDPASIDSVFISHVHRDHVGGVAAEKASTVALTGRLKGLLNKPFFVPEGMRSKVGSDSSSPLNIGTQVNAPQILMNAVASSGVIARQLVVGRVNEQALVIDLADKGLVVVVGCGHQTLAKLLSRIERVFNKPIYAIVGDLHYPVPSGRLRLFGVDVQRRLASGDGLFEPLSEADVDAFEAMLERSVEHLALGGHDTSDVVLARLQASFGARFRSVLVGQSLVLHDY